MKDYRVSKNGKCRYITKIEKGNNDTLEIVFADGRRFKNIENNEKNIERLNSIMEEQAKDGVKNYVTLKSREHASKIKMFLSSTAICAGGVAAMVVSPQISDYVNTNPVISAAGIGTIAILGAIPAYCSFRKNHARVKELDKIRYRDSYKDRLYNFRNYENSLSGFNIDKVEYFENTKNPFSMINIDNYDEEDLQTIVGNIQLEDDLGLTYKKTKNSNKCF